MKQASQAKSFKARLHEKLCSIPLPGGFKSNLLYSGKQIWIIPVYAVFYIIAFIYLEKSVLPGSADFHLITFPLDQYIPFLEVFIIPYMIWFAFMGLTIFYFAALDPTAEEFHKLCFNLALGMTVFIVLCFVYHNGLTLRPDAYPRDNFLTNCVDLLYSKDTATNVFPSIHVYNTICCWIAVSRCPSLNRFGWIQKGLVPITSILIILATMFLKQHSVTDVLGAIALNILAWILIYKISDWRKRKKEAA